MVLTNDELEALADTSSPLATELWDELAENGMTKGSTPPPADRGVCLTGAGVEFGGLEPIARRIASATSWIGARVVLLSGMVLAVWTLWIVVTGQLIVAGVDAGLTPVPSVLTLLILSLGLAAIHESGHAVVLARFGGRVGRAGFGFHWGDASVFVDSTAALFLPRNQRIIQAAAGVGTELFVASSAVVVATAVDSDLARFVAGALLINAVASAVLNGAPVLGLDGSLIVSDLFDRPTMPIGSGRTLSSSGRLSRTIDVSVGVIAILASTWLWAQLWWDLLVPLWHQGVLGALVAGLSLLPTAAALTVGLVGLIAGQHDRET